MKYGILFLYFEKQNKIEFIGKIRLNIGFFDIINEISHFEVLNFNELSYKIKEKI